MITLTAQSKSNITLTSPSKSYDYTIDDLADYEIQELDFTFENQEIILAKSSKNNISITAQTK
jgi:hypothetical protein